MDKLKDREIWVLDDDSDDQELLETIFKELALGVRLRLFQNSENLLRELELSREAPFMIISDVNLPKKGGFALREEMLRIPNSKFHSVPFIFWSTSASDWQIHRAFELRAHGFFQKDTSLADWKKTLTKIIEYWSTSLMPPKADKVEPPLL